MKICAITGKHLDDDEVVHCAALRPSLLDFIQQAHPALTHDDCIDANLLPALRAGYVEKALEDELGELSDLEREVIHSLEQHEIVSENPEDEEQEAHRTFGERLSDRIATFGGSWKFILSFCGFLMLWILANTLLWRSGTAPDPYPYILLNLLLSCIAALQAPLIMMSQKRQESRDRHHAEQDYQVNLKAELEIRHLHEKMDHLLHHHSTRLMEIQQIQTDLLRQLIERDRGPHPAPSPPSAST